MTSLTEDSLCKIIRYMVDGHQAGDDLELAFSDAWGGLEPSEKATGSDPALRQLAAKGWLDVAMSQQAGQNVQPHLRIRAITAEGFAAAKECAGGRKSPEA